jgi:hypothetical protein
VEAAALVAAIGAGRGGMDPTEAQETDADEPAPGAGLPCASGHPLSYYGCVQSAGSSRQVVVTADTRRLVSEELTAIPRARDRAPWAHRTGVVRRLPGRRNAARSSNGRLLRRTGNCA